METGKTRKVITVQPVEEPRGKPLERPQEAPAPVVVPEPEREKVPVRRTVHETHVRGGLMRWQKRDDWRARYGSVPVGDPAKARR